MKRFCCLYRDDDYSQQVAHQFSDKLINNGFIRDKDNPEIVIVFGGDGSILQAVHRYIEHSDDIIFIGIKTGTLGFLCDYMDDELDIVYQLIINNQLTVKQYPLLQVIFDNHLIYAVNEVRLENIVRTLDMEVYINDQYFESYRGTGMCVCTQLGSTGYNRSINGAVIQEGLDAIEMSQIAGIHHNKYRSLQSPLILDSHSKICFKSNDFSNARLGIDSDSIAVDTVKDMTIQLSGKKFNLVRQSDCTYLHRLSSLF